MCLFLSLQYTALQLLGEERLLRQNGQDKDKEKHGKSDSAGTTDNGEIETQSAAGEGIMLGREVPGDPSPPQQLLDLSHIPSTSAVPIIWSEVRQTLNEEAQLVPAHVTQLSTLSSQQHHVSLGGAVSFW